MCGLLINYYASIQEIDLSVYHQFLEQFPNTTFILFPTMPIKPAIGDEPFAQSINRTIQNQQAVTVKLLQSGLPVVNLSGSLDANKFKDIVHFKGSGKRLLQQRLFDYLT